MLSPFDDYPIHSSADPIAHTASGDPNHYDRYFFNGHSRDGALFFAAAMGHYPNRGVVDAAVCIVIDGVQHSLFASGRMPLDRATTVGPFRIEIRRPLRELALIVGPNDHGIEADLVFTGRSAAVEEPRQHKLEDDGRVMTDHTRMTQWGAWNGSITLDGQRHGIDPADITGTKDRSWGVRPVGERTRTNVPRTLPQAFWLWAPLHFDDRFTHLALHEHSDGSRWLETAMVVDPLPDGAEPWHRVGLAEGRDIRYDFDWRPGRREMERASISFVHPHEGDTRIELERLATFHMRGIGYQHPEWAHGTAHGELATARESVEVDRLDPTDFANIHIQTVVRARMGARTGIGVLEQGIIGPHEPTGLTGLTQGHGG